MKSSEVKALLKSLDISPLKSLGQNFLINQDIIQKIVAVYNFDDFKRIIEIGPGLGSLTNVISKDNKSKMSLLELDRSLGEYWEEKGFDVFKGDALKFNWQDLKEKTILISNLPYQISSRVLVEMFLSGAVVTNMVLMFQEEVGERIQADVEDKKIYGLLSILCELEWKVKKVTSVSKECFYPSPDIRSVVLSFERKKKLEKSFDRKAFVLHLKTLFSARRKKIRGTLKKALKNSKEISLDILEKRPDQLSPEEHLSLFIEVFGG